MSDYKQTVQTIDVPMDTGVEGFLLAIRNILTLSRVTEVSIHDKGKVTYKRWVRDEDDANANLRIDFESVTPIGVVRNNDIIDAGLVDDSESPAETLVRLMMRVEADHLYPTAFVISTNSVFFDWFSGGSVVGMAPNAERLFGHRLLRDRFVEDSMLLLCAGYGPGGSLIDTRVTYRLTLPSREAPVRILPGAEDEAVGSDGEGWSDRRGEAVGAPAVGSAGTRPGGTVARLPDVLPGGADHGPRKGDG